MPVSKTTQTRLRYMSLFTGIGGFEQAIHRVYPSAECVGFSEIKPAAIRVYSHHFPDHPNLGDTLSHPLRERHMAPAQWRFARSDTL